MVRISHLLAMHSSPNLGAEKVRDAGSLKNYYGNEFIFSTIWAYKMVKHNKRFKLTAIRIKADPVKF